MTNLVRIAGDSAAKWKKSIYLSHEIPSFDFRRRDTVVGSFLEYRLAGRRKDTLEARCFRHREIQWRGAKIVEHVSLGEEGPPLGASLEALLAPQHQRARGLRTRSANRQAAWRRGRVVGFRCAGSTAGNFRMERAQRRAIAARVLPPRQGWARPGIANPPETRRQAHVLIYAAHQELASIDAVIPGDAKRPRLDSHDHRIACLKTVEIVGIHRQTFVLLSLAPRAHEEPSCATHDSRHIVAAVHRGCVVGEFLGCIQSPIEE